MLKHIKYNESGLLPCVTQDYKTKKVLMLAYMNEESLEKTIQSGIAHYFSRSRQKLWQKGESSGHIQMVREITFDCDLDSVLLQVEQEGVACHTGEESCFFNRFDFNVALDSTNQIKDNCLPKSRDISCVLAKNYNKSIEIYGILDTLYHILLDRKMADPSESYSASLFSKGENAIGKKIIEEAGEFCFALKDFCFKDSRDSKEIVHEGADMFYHIFVALAYCDINPYRIYAELERRFGTSGIIEKNSREN